MASYDRAIDVDASEVNVAAGDLFKHQFATALVGGYSRRDVDEFVDRTAEEMHRLERQVDKLERENASLTRKLEAVHDRESTLRDALVNAQQFGENVVENARREADSIRTEAEVHRERMLVEARRLPDALEREIRELEERRDRLMRDLRAVLETHQRLLDGHAPAEGGEPESAKKRAIGSAFAEESPPSYDKGPDLDDAPPEALEPARGQRRVHEDIVELSDLLDGEDRE